jgi:hypothetical protein
MVSWSGKWLTIVTRLIIGLQNRVAWLESIIKTRCPDIDLSQETPSVVASELNYSLQGLSANNQSNDSGSREASVDAGTANIDCSTEAVRPETTRRSQTPAIDNVPEPISEVDRELGFDAATSTHQIGLIALGSGQDPRYIGPSSGYVSTRSIRLVCPLRKSFKHSHTWIPPIRYLASK